MTKFYSSANQCFYVYYDEETLNANNFPSREACLAVCGETSPTEQQLSEAICSLPPPPTKEWPSNSTVGFWYDEKNDRCEPIYYDDETKNANNFNSVENCLKTCSSASAISTTESPQPETSTSTTTIFRPRQDGPLPSLSSETTINPKNEERDRISAPKPNDSKLTTNKPVNTESTNLPQSSTPTSTPPSTSPSTTSSSTTTTATTTTTTTTKKPTTTQPKKLSTEQVLKLPECSLQPRNGHCKALMRSYYFNITTMRCQQYTYGGCGATANHYRTETACEQSCIYRKLTYQSPIILTPPKPLRTPNDKYCKIPLFDNKCSQRAHQGFVFEPSTNSCHFTVLQRCSRPLALHKRREDCLSSCAQTPPKIAKVPLFRSN
uniref:BPTI/Kunitz inhibitor domain-containing protein n=1 Tax=Panagrolaimus sp. ES5 TaxID=591445 RepID=A0AC34FQ67_9BILA